MFALVAAHGALWASWYLVCAKLAAMVLAVVDPTSWMSPRKRYREFSAYMAALKEINQLVMIETFILIHTIQTHGADAAIAKGIPEDLTRDYAKVLDSGSRAETVLRDLYHRHFTWE